MTIPQISGSQESFYDQPEPCTIGVSKHSARGNIMKAFPTFWWSERRSCRSCTPKWSWSTSGSLRVHFSITFNYFVSNFAHFLRGTIFLRWKAPPSNATKTAGWGNKFPNSVTPAWRWRAYTIWYWPERIAFEASSARTWHGHADHMG